ncbi:hypothetical protein QTP88_022094 [Uroleucon formosanum]
MKRKNFTPTKYSYLCSEHFGPNDYQIRPGADIKLLLEYGEYAIPSIFKGFPTHLQKKKLSSPVVSTASNERFFSSFKRVKSYLRSSMGNEHLSDLMVIAVEKEYANKIDLDKAVDRFSKQKVEGIS